MWIMEKSKMSTIVLFVLGLLVLACAVGMALFEWEWWPFLLVLSSLAFLVGLILFLIRRILT